MHNLPLFSDNYVENTVWNPASQKRPDNHSAEPEDPQRSWAYISHKWDWIKILLKKALSFHPPPIVQETDTSYGGTPIHCQMSSQDQLQTTCTPSDSLPENSLLNSDRFYHQFLPVHVRSFYNFPI